MNAGLTPTHQVPASTIATIEVSDQPVTALWRELFDHQGVRDHFVRAAREYADGLTVLELYDALEADNIPYWIRSRLRDMALGDRREAWRLVGDIVPNHGHGHSTVEDVLATAGLFEAVSETGHPTVAFVIDREFEQQERRKRVDVCRLIATLSRGLDVRFVASGVTQAFVRNEHREELPGVSEWRNTARDMGPLAETVDEATAGLDPDGRDVQILRSIADEPSETLAYSALYAQYPELQDSRVRQCIGRLVEYELVATFGPTQSRKVELLEAVRSVLETFDAKIGRQRSLEASVSETGQTSPQCRVTTRTGCPPTDGAGPYQVGWMKRHQHDAATACGRSGGVTLADGRLPAADGRTHEVSYDADRGEVVVAVQAAEPLPYTVSTAVALATPWFVDDALVPRLDEIDEPPAILRDARCIGALSDEALDDPQVLRDELVDWGQRIQDLTVDLHNGEYDDRNTFRSVIMRLAHGLSGSIVHLFDAVGVDVVRELRVPEGADRDDLEALAKTISISTAIQSRYNGVYSVYRQLFEARDEKRARSFTATPDATDPTGALIGSLVIRGSDLHRLRPALEHYLESPGELADDAPEINLSVPIRETGREEIANASARVLSRKNLRSTRETISLCHGLVEDPYAVARGLEQLSDEELPRELRPDELRVSIGALEPEYILRDETSTVSKAVSTLLVSGEPLSKTELADRAEVSTRSVTRNADRLEALGLLSSEGGYRLEISFQTAEERKNPVVPSLVSEGDLLGTVDALLESVLSVERYADPEDPLGSALFWPPDPYVLADHDEYGGWFELALRLADLDDADSETVVTMGPRIAQQSLPTTEMAT